MRFWKILALNLFLSLLVIGLYFGLFQFDPRWPFALPGWLVPLAWPLYIGGSTLIIWAVIVLFRHSGSSAAPGDPTVHLVDAGPYRWCRNPIYFGDMLLVFGVAFSTHSLTALVFALLLPFLVDWYVRKVEEPRTELRLGETYLSYQQRVPRWIPRQPKDKA